MCVYVWLEPQSYTALGDSRRIMMSVATHSASPTWQLGAATHADMLGLEAVKGRRQLFHQVSPTVASSYLPPNGQLRHLKHSSGLRGGQLALDWAPPEGQYM